MELTSDLAPPRSSARILARRQAGKRWVAASMGVALALSLGACASTSTKGASGSTPAAASGQSSPSITIKSFAFNPGTITVKPGATVTVDNTDSVTHTLTSDTGVFNTGSISGGSTGHFTAPMKPGHYAYRCNIHQFMTGTIVVS